MGYALVLNKSKTYHIFSASIINKYDDRIDIKLNKKLSECGKTKEQVSEVSLKSLHKDNISLNNKEYFYFHNYGDICYFEEYITARIVIASLIGKKTCGICVSILYTDE